jgi:hypothetical protein
MPVEATVGSSSEDQVAVTLGVVPNPDEPGRAGAASGVTLSFSGVLDDTGGTGVTARVRELVGRYSPVFVLFPEATDRAVRPYPHGTHDYHPRSVEGYLQRASLIPVAYATWMRLPITLLRAMFTWGPFIVLCGAVGWVGAAVAIYLLGLVLTGIADAQGLDVGLEGLAVRDIATGFVGLAIAGALLVVVLDYLLSPRGLEAIKARLAATDHFHESYALKLRWRPGLSSPDAAWADYTKWLKSRTSKGADDDRVVYLRVVRGDGPAELVLQYWLFYHYNDWKNSHEADWECVTQFFATRDHRLEPIAAAYSAHLGAYWRRWPDVRTTVGPDGALHPLVYVARGSHANYFEPRRSGYRASVEVPTEISSGWRLPLLDRLKVRFMVGGRQPSGRSKDYVPFTSPEQVADLPNVTYRIAAMPLRRDYIDPAGERTTWDAWWWLSYRGKWGLQGRFGLWGVDAPIDQIHRWERPTTWVSEEGQADAQWEDVFETA